jgi:hypothetical protein
MSGFLTPDAEWVDVEITYTVTVNKEVYERAKVIAEGESATDEDEDWMDDLADHVSDEIRKQDSPAYDLGYGKVVNTQSPPH